MSGYMICFWFLFFFSYTFYSGFHCIHFLGCRISNLGLWFCSENWTLSPEPANQQSQHRLLEWIDVYTAGAHLNCTCIEDNKIIWMNTLVKLEIVCDNCCSASKFCFEISQAHKVSLGKKARIEWVWLD